MRRRSAGELALAAIVLFVAFVFYLQQPFAPVAASSNAIERGRLVYIAEDCARCHTHDAHPGTRGTTNRRQGPDLSQVGARRSALWLKMHLYNPREVSGSSIMPSYAILFRNRRGNDLVAYLASLGAPTSQQHIAVEQQWHLPVEAFASASPADGLKHYNRYCATCHNANGRTRLKWQSEFIESPAVLTAAAITVGAMQDPAITKPASARIDHFAQIIKFGIPASDMAGHEHMSDEEIASLSLWLVQNTAQPAHKQ